MEGIFEGKDFLKSENIQTTESELKLTRVIKLDNEVLFLINSRNYPTEGDFMMILFNPLGLHP